MTVDVCMIPFYDTCTLDDQSASYLIICSELVCLFADDDDDVVMLTNNEKNKQEMDDLEYARRLQVCGCV